MLLPLQESQERQGLDLHEDFGLPKSQPMSPIYHTTPRIIEEELSYDTSYLQGKVLEQCRTLNRQHWHAFDTVMPPLSHSHYNPDCAIHMHAEWIQLGFDPK